MDCKTQAPDKKSDTRNKPALKVGCWNARTMTTGLSMDLQDISDARKMAVINNELLRLEVVIAALQETHLAETGSL